MLRSCRTFYYSQTERAVTFVDDADGRWMKQEVNLAARARMHAFTDLAMEALSQPDPDWIALSDRLPRPFTDEERRALIRADQELQEQDAFATWQHERRH
jgi:hypothetical protein